MYKNSASIYWPVTVEKLYSERRMSAQYLSEWWLPRMSRAVPENFHLQATARFFPCDSKEEQLGFTPVKSTWQLILKATHC